MNAVGIDVSKGKSMVAIMRPFGEIVSPHKTASQIKDDAEAEAISQKEQILKKAEKEIADMVVDAAAKVVGSNSADTNAALYDTFLNKAGDK